MTKLLQYITNSPAWLRFVFVVVFTGIESCGLVKLLSVFTYRSNSFTVLGTFCLGWLTCVFLGGFLMYKLKLFGE